MLLSVFYRFKRLVGDDLDANFDCPLVQDPKQIFSMEFRIAETAYLVSASSCIHQRQCHSPPLLGNRLNHRPVRIPPHLDMVAGVRIFVEWLLQTQGVETCVRVGGLVESLSGAAGLTKIFFS